MGCVFFRGRNKEKYYNQTYRALMGIRVRRCTRRLSTRSPGLSDGRTPNELRFFNFAIRHLENKHGDEYNEWERNQQEFSTRMREHFPDYREESLEHQENYYDLSQLLMDIYNNIYDTEKTGKASERQDCPFMSLLEIGGS